MQTYVDFGDLILDVEGIRSVYKCKNNTAIFIYFDSEVSHRIYLESSEERDKYFNEIKKELFME